MYVSCRASQTSDEGPIFKIPSPLWTYLQSYVLGLNCVPPKFIWWGPNQPPTPLPHSVWLYLEIDRAYQEVIRVKWGQKGRALTNRTSLLTPKSAGGGWEAGEVLSLSLPSSECTQRRGHVSTQPDGSQPRAKKKWSQNKFYPADTWSLHFPASRMVRSKFLLFRPPSLWHWAMQPEETNPSTKTSKLIKDIITAYGKC